MNKRSWNAALFLFCAFGILQAQRGRAQTCAECVLTHHNNVQRTGVYDHEFVLSPTNVQSPFFGRLCIRKVDAEISAQPLYVKGVMVSGTTKNVLYVVTRNNSIYAFDADNVDPKDPHGGMAWPNPVMLKFTEPGTRLTLFAIPLRKGVPCQQTVGPIGITSTPVIDAVSRTMYLVARFGRPSLPLPAGRDVAGVYHALVAIDITTGQELRRTIITAPGFFGTAELNRPALLLLNNVIYVGFGAPVCDSSEEGADGPKPHGFVFAYSAPDLRQLAYFNTSPQDRLAAIWQSGAGLAADPQTGNVYAITGNNQIAEAVPNYPGLGTPLGESILKLRLAGGRFVSPPEHLTAGNWKRLDTGEPRAASANRDAGGDSDLGSGGPVVLANGWVVGGGKQGRMYVLDPNDMAHPRQTFQASFNTFHLPPPSAVIKYPDASTCQHDRSPSTCRNADSRGQPCVISTCDYDFEQNWGPNIHGAPVVWQPPGSGSGLLYGMAEKDYLRAYTIHNNGRIDDDPFKTSQSTSTSDKSLAALFPNGLRSPDGMPGGAVSLSSNGNMNGIVWVSLSPENAMNNVHKGVLIAFEADNLKLLWSDPDDKISFAKFVPPTIAGGKVFRATFGDGYSDPSCAPNGDQGGNTGCGSIVIYGHKSLRVIRPH